MCNKEVHLLVIRTSVYYVMEYTIYSPVFWKWGPATTVVQ